MPAFLPATRAEALERLDEFLPLVPAYAATRNQVVPGHGNVSRLSPATRTRLILEREILARVRERCDPRQSVKFEQEVWWRLYWKGWLEQRSAVWTAYRKDLDGLEWSERAEAVASGNSGIAILDHFARELVTTGYLHNHARMWWASWWIHGEGLPWQLGADFFLRHLRDGDAASNTLSWRWVAGLHTRGKAYLVRRSNLEACIDPGLLAEHSAGLDRLDGIRERALPWEEAPAVLPLENPDWSPGRHTGLWIHDEDLLVENSPLAACHPVAAMATAAAANQAGENPDKPTFLLRALADGADRASKHFGLSVPVVESAELPASLTDWAAAEGLDTVVTLRPFTGPLADQLPAIGASLAARKIRLELVRRPEDVAAMNLATGGFFKFWEQVQGT